jgi:uncharacterized protein
MLLDLTRIRQPETPFEATYDPERVAGGGTDYTVATPVVLRMTIHKDKERFRLVGHVDAGLDVPCGRCLEPFRLRVDGGFDLRYVPQREAAADAHGEREIDEDDLSLTFYEDEAIDLGGLLQEQFYLALPMKPLCRASCRGLCPECGTNLNQATCGCTRAWVDPRLEPLKAFTTDRKRDDA